MPMVELHLKPGALARWDLPDLAYPLPLEAVRAVLDEDGLLPFDQLLHGLQQQARDGQAPWQALEPAMARLASLLAPQEDWEVVTVEGHDWLLEIGPVDLAQRIVTIQRGEHLVAALCPRLDGSLRVSVYRPLDAKSAGYLLSGSVHPDPVHGVAMRENNWEYMLDASSSFSHCYAADRGEAYLSRWDAGLGTDWNGQVLPHWAQQRGLVPMRPACVCVQLAVHDMLSTPG